MQSYKLKDGSIYEIDMECMESYPCQHRVKHGAEKKKCVSEREIAQVLLANGYSNGHFKTKEEAERKDWSMYFGTRAPDLPQMAAKNDILILSSEDDVDSLNLPDGVPLEQ